jgi:hypothetical protein
MSAIVRGLIVVVGVLLMLGGMATLAMPGVGAIAFLQLFGFGAFLVIAVAIERQRYRSEAAERSRDLSPGPGGGEPSGAIEPRFRPSNEVFIDPTTGVRMRVVVDPANGERRYVAEA